jgi:hypothetical protein
LDADFVSHNRLGHLTKNSSKILLSRIGSRLKNSRFRRDSEQIEGMQETEILEGRSRVDVDKFMTDTWRFNTDIGRSEEDTGRSEEGTGRFEIQGDP